ncbi:MAG TPA: ATP-binding protein [Alphaproteobacteria bacterium]|nr:ATP-binding protein [Alphaproteobacteria bacterium]
MANEWTERELLERINNSVEENATLDYKACDALQKNDGKRNEVSKDVSAFANSAGGIIIYGITERGHIPDAVDEGFNPQEISKEWLEHVINGKIQPRIGDVTIFSVSLTTTHPGKVAYVVDIPQSHTAHQASDKRYYKRFNFESVPMEDYEVRDVMNRRKHPILVPYFSYVTVTQTENSHRYDLRLRLTNEGSVRAIDIKCLIYFPRQCFAHSDATVGRAYRPWRSMEMQTDSGDTYQVCEIELKKTSFVIFPDDEWMVTNDADYILRYVVNSENWKVLAQLRPPIRWKIYADDMPPREGEFPFDEWQRF